MITEEIKTKGIPVKMEDGMITKFCGSLDDEDCTSVILDKDDILTTK